MREQIDQQWWERTWGALREMYRQGRKSEILAIYGNEVRNFMDGLCEQGEGRLPQELNPGQLEEFVKQYEDYPFGQKSHFAHVNTNSTYANTGQRVGAHR